MRLTSTSAPPALAGTAESAMTSQMLSAVSAPPDSKVVLERFVVVIYFFNQFYCFYCCD